VDTTGRWIAQAVKLLEECTRTKKLSSLQTLRDHFRRLDLDSALKDLGCDLKCDSCTWGIPGAHPLQTACRLGALRESVLGMETSEKQAAPILDDARQLLAVLAQSPRPRKA
jgi:hypothetical protein